MLYSTHKKKIVANIEIDGFTAEVTPGGKPEEEKPAEEPWVQVKADFEMEKIGVSLYTGTHDLVSRIFSSQWQYSFWFYY